MKLNQIIAIEQGIKTKGGNTLTTKYHEAQKPGLFNGLVRNYKPLHEDGEKFPSEKNLVQFRAADIVEEVVRDVSDWFNIELSKDEANCTAIASVVVDGETLLTNAPSTYLLFLEKKLIDVGTFVNSLPTLDPAEEWTWDPATNYWRSNLSQTAKTKKVQKALQLLAPTKEHPGQAVQVTDDQIVGYWEQTRLSGALTVEEKNKLTVKVEKLAKAVKLAREEANQVEATQKNQGAKLLSWIFEK